MYVVHTAYATEYEMNMMCKITADYCLCFVNVPILIMDEL